MSFRISVSGAAADAVRSTVPTLVADMVASGITALDPALWGPEAEDEPKSAQAARHEVELLEVIY